MRHFLRSAAAAFLLLCGLGGAPAAAADAEGAVSKIRA